MHITQMCIFEYYSLQEYLENIGGLYVTVLRSCPKFYLRFVYKYHFVHNYNSFLLDTTLYNAHKVVSLTSG